VTDVVAGCLLLLGSFVGLLAAVGLVRMPDFFGRLQASTKAQTLGLVTILLGAGLALNDFWVWLRLVALVLFVFMTSPLSGQMIARAAYLLGVPLWDKTTRDDLDGKYDFANDVLRGKDDHQADPAGDPA
jgi:multicomponent Na+:H+ antiporter subunit G